LGFNQNGLTRLTKYGYDHLALVQRVGPKLLGRKSIFAFLRNLHVQKSIDRVRGKYLHYKSRSIDFVHLKTLINSIDRVLVLIN
jgi:membrane-bound lytic murein transglycosylase MltF